MKQFPRRQFLHLAAVAAALPLTTPYAKAQSYPSRSVRIVVGFAPGGAPDILARLVAQWLSERLGQQFIVENRAGGGTNIATEAVVRAPADGYSLLLASGANAINATLYDKLNFDFIRDIAPVAGVVRTPLVMVVTPSFPAKTIGEFIALARANPGKINMASPGTGSAPHLAGELFKMMAGVDMTHVPYRGGPPAIADLLGGQVQVFLGATTFLIGYIRAGKLRGLAVSTTMRLEALPEIPSMSEFVPGFEASDWFGIVAPKATPTEIVDQLNKEINACLADPTIREQLAEQGTVLAGPPRPSANSSQMKPRSGGRWLRSRASRRTEPGISRAEVPSHVSRNPAHVRIDSQADIGRALPECPHIIQSGYRQSRFGMCMGHVWTAPSWQGFSSRRMLGRCSHVFGLLVRFA